MTPRPTADPTIGERIRVRRLLQPLRAGRQLLAEERAPGLLADLPVHLQAVVLLVLPDRLRGLLVELAALADLVTRLAQALLEIGDLRAAAPAIQQAVV